MDPLYRASSSFRAALIMSNLFSLFVFLKKGTIDKVKNLRFSKCYLPSLEPYITEENFGLVSPGVMFSTYIQQNILCNQIPETIVVFEKLKMVYFSIVHSIISYGIILGCINP